MICNKIIKRSKSVVAVVLSLLVFASTFASVSAVNLDLIETKANSEGKHTDNNTYSVVTASGGNYLSNSSSISGISNAVGQKGAGIYYSLDSTNYTATVVDTNTTAGSNNILTFPDEVAVKSKSGSSYIYYNVTAVNATSLSKLNNSLIELNLNKRIYSMGNDVVRNIKTLKTISVDGLNGTFYANDNILYRVLSYNIEGNTGNLFEEVSVYAVPQNYQKATLTIPSTIRYTARTLYTNAGNPSGSKIVDLPVTRLYQYSLTNLQNVTTISFGANVKYITYHQMGDGTIGSTTSVMSSNPKLQKFVVDNKNPNFVAGDNGKTLYSNDHTILYRYANNNSNTSFTSHQNTEVIAYGCFEDAKNLKTINLNYDGSKSRVRYFGQNAFMNCNNLTKIIWSPQNYYYVLEKVNDKNNYVKKANLAQFVASALNNAQVNKGQITDVPFSIGYSQILLTKNTLYFGDTTTEKDIVNKTEVESNKNNVLRQALQLWYKPLYEYINEKVNAQTKKADTIALTEDIKNIISDNNKGFLNIDDLKSDSDRYKSGSANGNDTYLTKAGKWTNEEKTKAKVNINYTSGTTTGIDIQLQIDKTASMISTGSSNVVNSDLYSRDDRKSSESNLITDFGARQECPASRVYEQYSFVYNLTKGLTENNTDKVQNRVSVSAFTGSNGNEGYVNVFSESETNYSYECGPFLTHKISDISKLSYDNLFTTSSTKMAKYLNSIDIENAGRTYGTSYYQATRCAIEILKAKQKSSEKPTQVILVSDGEPNDSTNTVSLETKANISAKAEELRKIATVYTVLEGKFSTTALTEARTAMGWVSGYNYDELHRQDYDRFNYSGSNQTELTKAFESIFDNIIEYKNTVIKDVVNNTQFTYGGNASLEVNKSNVLYDFVINYNNKDDNGLLINKILQCTNFINYDGSHYYNYSSPNNVYVRSLKTGAKYPISNEDTTVGSYGYKFKFRVPVSEENSKFIFEGVKTDGTVVNFLNTTTATSGIKWNLFEKNFVKIVTGVDYYDLTSTTTDCVVADKEYVHHTFKIGDSKSGRVLLANLTCTECGKKFSDIFTNDNQENSYAYFGSAKIGTTYRPTIEIHIPTTDYTDIFNLSFDVDLLKSKYNTGGDFLTNFDTNSDGCFVYDETSNAIDDAMKGNYPNKTQSNVTIINKVATPLLKRDTPTLNIKAELYQEKYNYSDKEYTMPISDENTTYIAKCSDGTEYTVTSTNGVFDFSSLKVFDEKTGDYASYTITRKTSVPVRYTADKLTFTFTSADVEKAVKNKETLTCVFKDTLKKATLNIKKTAFDNEVENIYFKVVTPNINSTKYGTYENIVKTDSTGTATITELPIYDVDNTFVTYKVDELGVLKDDGTYEIPFKYLEPLAQEFTFKNGNTYTAVKTVSFENKKRPTGNIEIIKTSEDGIVKDIAFMVTGTDGTKVIVTTNDNGKATVNELFVSDKEGNKFEYTVKELGVLKKGAVAGSQNENDYEFPIRYEKQQDKTVTLDDTPAKTITVSFDNKLLKGTINVIKKDTDDNTLEGVGYVLCDNDKNIVPLDLNSKNSATYSKNGRTDYTLYTDKNGKISIDKLPILDDGEYYYIKEVSTIEGFNLLKDYVKIENLSYTQLEVTQNITNNPKYILPMTGLNSYNLLGFIGIIVLAIGTGTYIFVRRRKQSHTNN